MQSFTQRFSSTLEQYRFPRSFWVLTLGSFVNRLGNFIIPFFSLYLTAYRHLSIGETTLVISLMGFGSLAAGICGGVLADTLGRRTTILISTLAATGMMLALSFATTIWIIVPLAIIYTFFSDMQRPASSATIADVTPSDKLSQAYGLRYWANNIGNAIGPVLAGLLAPISYLLLFIGDAFTTFCFAVLVWFGVPETHVYRTQKKEGEQLQRSGQVSRALTDPLLWIYGILAFFFDAIYIQDMTAMPLDMQAHGLQPLAYGSVMAINAALVVAISLPLTAFFSHRSRNLTLALAALLLGTGMGLFSWLHSYPGYLLGVIIWTLGEILNLPISMTIIADISPKHLRGTYQGVFQTIRAFSIVIAPALGGFVLQNLGAAFFWQCCLIVGVLVATGYVVLEKARQQRKNEDSIS